jgi:hypothetical protein
MTRWLIGVLFLGVLFASGVGLLHAGVYAWTIFVVHPLLLGGLTCWVTRPKSARTAGCYGSIAALVASGLLFLIGTEGLICVLMSWPLVLPLGCFGGWFAYRVMSSKRASRGAMVMVLMIPPATVAYDTHAQPPIYAVKTSIEVAASPGEVWRSLIHLSQLPNPHEWYFRAGLAYPISARIEGTGAGATRYCDFSTGPVVESIEVWDAPRVLRFRVTQNPAPMREWSPYGEIAPKHLHGYLISREGEFRLTPLSGNRTLLEGTSWYQHGLWPANYWRLLSDAIVHRIHLRVFRQIKTEAEHS